MAKIVYENKSKVINSDNYKWVYLPTGIKYDDLSAPKSCYNCVHSGRTYQDYYVFCCKYLNEICMCGSGICDCWASPKYWWLHVGPRKIAALKSLGIELVNVKQR